MFRFKKFNSKGIAPLIATILLISITVIFLVVVYTNIKDQSSNLLELTESQSLTSTIETQTLFDDILYLKSEKDLNLTLLQVKDRNQDVVCSFSGDGISNSTGLVGWWKFNEIINNSGVLRVEDFSGLNNHGTLLDYNLSNADGNTPPKLINNSYGTALKLDGIDDYINISNESIVKNAYNSSMIGIIDLKDSRCILAGEYINERYYNIRFAILKSHIIQDPYTPGGNSRNHLLNQNFRNQVGFYAYTQANTSLKYFLNGVQIAQRNNAQTYSRDISNLDITVIGRSILRHTNPFSDCSINEIQFYNRTLTNDEIKSIYWNKFKKINTGLNELDLSQCKLKENKRYSITYGTEDDLITNTIRNK